ncbi:hypothetical protein [Aeromicrobium sp.]|uniref:hypothetical protein n=1 Tax=Aeromicrobium sp. TaxID=1871063 RepID=UPI0025C6EDB6|nr:hypothetical protein [Aeromicrobium sp.]MCK5891353.1 hypothetical protein [Aeromicrobium sp.]
MVRWRRMASAALSAAVVTGALAGCQIGSGDPGAGAGSESAPDEITIHEGGPESPIVDGLAVPNGAVQLGPLARYRSTRIIEAYQPDLTVALTRQGVSDAVSAARNNPDGMLQPTPPDITKSGRPDDDTFALLEEPPPADVTVALIRIDADSSAGKSETVQALVAQIAALLPDAGVDPDDFGSYCTVVDERVTGCELEVEGVTADDRTLAISMFVDPGDPQTRISAPSTLTRPVMEVRVQDLSDPRVARSVADDATPPTEPGPVGADLDDVIWPAMDTQAPADTPLLNGWVAPEGTVILLSSFQPEFVTLHVPSSSEAREIARSYVESLAPDVPVTLDSYEGLNEVDVTFSATAPDGERAVATHVITARGNYVMLFHTPAS